VAAAMQVGALVAAFLTAVLLQYFDWRTVLALCAVPGLIWSVAFPWWFRNSPAEHAGVNAAELAQIAAGRGTPAPGLSASPEAVPWGKLVLSPSMWLICWQQFFRAAGYVWFGSWFATYLQETRHVTQERSGWLLSIPLFASFLASLASGSLSDAILRRTGKLALARKGLASASLGICAALVTAAYFIEDATAASTLIGLGAFCAALAGPCAYAVTIDMGGRHVAAVFSTMNMAGSFGAGLLPLVVPYFRAAIDAHAPLLELCGGNSWNAVLVLFALMYVLAAGFWMCLRVEGTVFGPSTDEVNR
jgi:MFS family permease